MRSRRSRGLVTGLGRTVGAAVVNAIIFGVGAGVTIAVLGILFHPGGGAPGWLGLVLMPLFSFIMWVALRPFRRLTTMVSPDRDHFRTAGGALGSAVRTGGDWTKRLTLAGFSAATGGAAAGAAAAAVLDDDRPRSPGPSRGASHCRQPRARRPAGPDRARPPAPATRLLRNRIPGRPTDPGRPPVRAVRAPVAVAARPHEVRELHPGSVSAATPERPSPRPRPNPSGPTARTSTRSTAPRTTRRSRRPEGRLREGLMRRRRGALAAVLIAAGCTFLGIPLLMVMVLMGGTAEVAEMCAPGSDTVVLAAGAGSGQLDQDQLANASAIVSEGARMAVPRRAMVVALAVAHQESRLPDLRQRRARGATWRRTRPASRGRCGCRTRRWAPITDRSASSSSSGPGGERCRR